MKKSIVGILLLMLSFIPIPGTKAAHALLTRADWDAAFQTHYGSGDPMLDLTTANRDGKFAWNGHYWIRAYVTMARSHGDTQYMDKAVDLIDFILRNRDDARAARGEIDIQSEPYYSAPLHYLNHRNEAAPGWRRRVENGWRIQLIDDAQIANAIMRFVDLALSDNLFSEYRLTAEEYIARVEETVQAHDSSFVYDRFDNIPGSYYYPNINGTGLYSGTVELNMNSTMGVTLLLLDKVKGGVPEYRRKAEAILEFFMLHLRTAANDAYDWSYHPQKPWIGVTATGDEDFIHGQVDISFINMAYLRGLNITTLDMQKFARTLSMNINKGDGELSWSVDGTEMNASKQYSSVGFDWIDLARFDTGIIDIAKTVYTKYYANCTWSWPFLGWAEIQSWSKMPTSPEPPQNIRVQFQ